VKIPVPSERVREFCLRHHVRRLAFFGSALREDFRPDSDVDVLVELEPGSSLGYLGLAAMERELAQILGQRVDLRTPAELSRYFRDEVLAEAEVQYVKE
jgi:predicted nucleotidyltransferase